VNLPIGKKFFDQASFAARVKERMEALSLSQGQLAEMTNLSQAAISRYLAGERKPDAEGLLALSYALNCQPVWLAGLEDSGGPTPEPSGADYVGPVSALEKTALSKALTVLRSKGVRGHPDQTLASNIETCFETVRYAEELGDNGGHVHGEGSAASSARRRRTR
jgi:transcriptional regulator with XRE-family HTH domain